MAGRASKAPELSALFTEERPEGLQGRASGDQASAREAARTALQEVLPSLSTLGEQACLLQAFDLGLPVLSSCFFSSSESGPFSALFNPLRKEAPSPTRACGL